MAQVHVVISWGQFDEGDIRTSDSLTRATVVSRPIRFVTAPPVDTSLLLSLVQSFCSNMCIHVGAYSHRQNFMTVCVLTSKTP